MTNVNILNNTAAAITCSSTVTPTLGSDYWDVVTNSVPANGTAPVTVLNFSRNSGIKDGDTWTFTTSFSLFGANITLNQTITGTFSSSTIQFEFAVNGVYCGWSSDLDTNNPIMIFQGNNSTWYSVTGNTFLNGAYDDVTYTVAEAQGQG